jgi:hypothetical protein
VVASLADELCALEFLQDTGPSRFSTIKPHRGVAASFEHIHNVVVAALTIGV